MDLGHDVELRISRLFTRMNDRNRLPLEEKWCVACDDEVQAADSAALYSSMMLASLQVLFPSSVQSEPTTVLPWGGLRKIESSAS